MTACCCLEKVGGVKNAIIWLIFLIILIVLLSLAIGSYGEVEPKAARMFGLIAVIYVVVAGLIAWRLTRKGHDASRR